MKSKLSFLILGALVFAGFVVRLYKIDNPVADWHSWRQADTSAVTRNYVKSGVDLLHPHYDDMSDVSGKGLWNPQTYRFVEFPIFNLIHYFFFTVFHHFTLEVWGRLTTIFSALVSSVLLFLIVRRRTTTVTGLLAAFFYLFLPYNIYFTRVILPDPLMVTFFLAALYAFDLKHPWLATILGSLAILVKPVAIFFLVPIYLSNIWLAPLMLLPFGLWRVWSFRYPQGVPPSAWLLNGNHIRFKGAFFQWIFGERIGSLILGKWGIFPMIVGFLNGSLYFLIWAFGAVAYLFTIATGNVQHDYYQIPIIPALSVLLAIGTVKLWHATNRTWLTRGVVVSCLLLMLALSWYDIRGDYQVNHWEIVHAGQAVDQLTPKDAVVIAPYGGDTAFLYQTNRKGFPYLYMPEKDLHDKFGAEYYVSTNFDADTNRIMNKYIVIAKTPEYVIVKLEEPIRPIAK